LVEVSYALYLRIFYVVEIVLSRKKLSPVIVVETNVLGDVRILDLQDTASSGFHVSAIEKTILSKNAKGAVGLNLKE
jgi:hypothetical protein